MKGNASSDFEKKNAVIVFLNVICIFVKHYLSGRVVYICIYLFKKHQIHLAFIKLTG